MRRGAAIIICLVMLLSLCLAVNGEDLPGIKMPIKPTTPITPIIPTTPVVPATPTTPTLPDKTFPTINENLDIIETLEAPSELKALTTEHNFISLQWEDNTTTETNFIIERKIQNSEYTQLSVLGKDITKYEDISVEPKTTYYYRVKAVKSIFDITQSKTKSTYSDYSNEIMINTPAAPSINIIRPDLDIKIPGEILLPQFETTSETTTPETTTQETTPAEEIKAPGELEAKTESENEILLIWQDNSDNEEGFLIFRTVTGEWEGVAVIDSNSEDYTDKNLQPDTTYYYVLYAYKGDSYSEPSNVVEIKTMDTAVTPIAETIKELAAPQSLNAKVQNPSEVLLTWQDNSDKEEGFLIFKTVTGEWEEAAKLNSNVTSYTDKALVPNTKYYYVVYAYAGDVASTESNIAEVTTPNQEAVVPAAVDYTGASSWALEELKKAVEYGLYTDNIMKNYSQNITREEFCELVIKMYEKLIGTGIIPVSPNPFRDTMNDSILKAFGAGIVKGTGADIFSPYNPITRQDICVMLYRAIVGAVPNIDTSITGVPSFADENLIGSWAINEVKFAYKNNIMKGIGNNMIGPKDNTNREQALMLVKRVYEAFSSVTRY